MTPEILQFVEQTKEQFDEWDNQIDQVESKIDSASGNLRSDYAARVDEMRFKLEEARGKLRDLEAAPVEGQWRLKAEVTEARDAVRELVSIGLSTMQ